MVVVVVVGVVTTAWLTWHPCCSEDLCSLSAEVVTRNKAGGRRGSGGTGRDGRTKLRSRMRRRVGCQSDDGGGGGVDGGETL